MLNKDYLDILRNNEIKYVHKTNGNCLEYFYNKNFYLCSDCFCEEICGLSRSDKTSDSIEKSKREQRYMLSKYLLREEKLKRIIGE